METTNTSFTQISCLASLENPRLHVWVGVHRRSNLRSHCIFLQELYIAVMSSGFPVAFARTQRGIQAKAGVLR